MGTRIKVRRKGVALFAGHEQALGLNCDGESFQSSYGMIACGYVIMWRLFVCVKNTLAQ